MYGLFYWLLFDLIKGGYALDTVSREGIAQALVAVGLFGAFVWLGSAIRVRSLPMVLVKSASLQLGPRAIFLALLVAFGLGMLCYAIPSGFDVRVMAAALLASRWAAPWSRGSLGGWDAFLDHLSYFGYMVPALTVSLANSIGSWLDRRVFVGLGASVIVTAFVAQGGSRRIVGVMIGAGLLTWLLQQFPIVRLKALVVVLGTVAALLTGMQFLLEYRAVGYGEAFVGDVDRRHFEPLHVDDNILRVGQVIELIPAQAQPVGFRWVLWVLVRPVPRVLWPGKPLDPGFLLPDMIGNTGASLSMSIVGEAYMAFGWLGEAAIGFLFGLLAARCNAIIARGEGPMRFLLYSFGAFALFAGLRSGIELVLMSYILLAWFAVEALVRQMAPTLLRQTSARAAHANAPAVRRAVV